MDEDAAQLDRRSAEWFVGRSVAGLAGLVLGAVAFAVLVALVVTGSPLLAVDRQVAAWLNSAVAGNSLLLSALGLAADLGGTRPAG